MTTKSTISELGAGEKPTTTVDQVVASDAKVTISQLDAATNKKAREIKPMASSNRVLKKSMIVDGHNIDKELSGDRVILIISGSKDAGGNQAVPIGLNGYMYNVPRDTPCNVPVEVAMVINDAVERIYDHSVGGRDSQQSKPRDIHRYSFSAMPTTSRAQEAVAA